MSDIRFVLTRYHAGILAYSINVGNGRLETVQYYAGQASIPEQAGIGDIFVARVMNTAANIKAAFIDYQKGVHGYLPFDKAEAPVLLNRDYDGRLKTGDEVLVQLEKEAVRGKEPVFTTNLSIAGKYCVITSGNRKKGTSGKCPRAVRERLAKALPDDISYGVIARTNAAELVLEENENSRMGLLEQECRRLSRQMETLLNEAAHRTCYSRVWKPPAPYLAFLRDIRNISYSRIVTDDRALYDELSAFLTESPEMLDKLSLYTDSSYSLNKLYSIETKLRQLTNSRVWLKSGAYLVIEKTEAMYVIDVNSGKNISKKPNDRYISAVNMEAAKEIMHQVRLRNLTGIIIVDFINMDGPADKEELLHELRRLASQDMVQTNVVDMTALDLVEITRQKNFKSLAEQLHCSLLPFST